MQESQHGGGILRRGDVIGPKTHPQSHLQIVPIEDAVLCAAAPELLEALEHALAAIQHLVYLCDHHDETWAVALDWQQWCGMAAPDPIEGAQAAILKAKSGARK